MPPEAFIFVHAHPDDETLWTGGLIATAAASGARVVVVTCTRGERGEVLTVPGTATEHLGFLADDGEALGAYRTTELRAALNALGPTIEHHYLDELPTTNYDDAPTRHSGVWRAATQPGTSSLASLGTMYRDSGMAWIAPGLAGPDPRFTGGFASVPVAEAASRLVPLIRDAKRASGRVVVVTYGPDGGYGHPDHVHAHRVAASAVNLANNDAVQLWEIATDGDIKVPVEPVLVKVLTALRAYPSQIQNIKLASASDGAEGVLAWFELSNAVPQPIRAHEAYRLRTSA